LSRRRSRHPARRRRGVTGEPEPLPLPLGLTAETFEVGEETLVVFAFPRRDALGRLTEAEREIAALVLGGRTSAQIAGARGVSRTTVSSQLQAIYRKLGVTSRLELICKLS